MYLFGIFGSSADEAQLHLPYSLIYTLESLHTTENKTYSAILKISAQILVNRMLRPNTSDITSRPMHLDIEN